MLEALNWLILSFSFKIAMCDCMCVFFQIWNLSFLWRQTVGLLLGNCLQLRCRNPVWAASQPVSTGYGQKRKRKPTQEYRQAFSYMQFEEGVGILRGSFSVNSSSLRLGYLVTVWFYRLVTAHKHTSKLILLKQVTQGLQLTCKLMWPLWCF